MPSLAELRKQKLKEQEESKKVSEVKITPGIEKIPEVQKKDKKTKPEKFKICPTCNKRKSIKGEKEMNKDELIQWFQNFVSENETTLPLDWLRGVKLSFECVNEIRK